MPRGKNRAFIEQQEAPPSKEFQINAIGKYLESHTDGRFRIDLWSEIDPACYVRENINFLKDKYKITEETEDYEKEEKEYEEKLGKLEERDLLEGLERMGEIDL